LKRESLGPLGPQRFGLIIIQPTPSFERTR
jgi:hypothetical protein